MLVSAFQKTELTPLQIVTDKVTIDADERLHAIACKTETLSATNNSEPVLQVIDNKDTPNDFSITFSYAQQLHRTRVLKIGVGYRKPAYVYKVVLNSRLSGGESQLCWLQQTQQGWNILLGNNLDNQLVKAITTAIESME
ncbi:hypothetical protein [Mucilaginibacter polytrichastri]|nr:hypothetical protein [Mucilaginibacter polytrichastri]